MSSACAKQKNLNNSSISEIDDDAPVITQEMFDKGRFRIGMKDVTREEWQAAVQATRKQRINIMLDAQTVAWFKAKAGDRGYQTLINETLRQAISQSDFEGTLRRVIREELKKAA